MTPLPPSIYDEVHRRFLENPHTHGTSVSLGEALFLAQLQFHLRPERSLEVGLAHAGSAAAIAVARRAAGMKTKHLALDPYQATHSSSMGLKELERQGLRDEIEWIPDWSERFLAKACEEKRQFDFIFIDGGHSIGQAVVDAYWANRVLPIGGHVAIHDAFLFSTFASVRFLADECKYEAVRPVEHPTMLRRLKCLKHSWLLSWRYAFGVLAHSAENLVLLKKVADIHPDDY